MNTKNLVDKNYLSKPELNEIEEDRISLEVINNYDQLNKKCDDIITKVKARKSKKINLK